MKKKIAFIAWERFSYGGISRVISDIVNELCNEYDITIICLKDAKYVENVYNIDFTKVKIIHHELTFAQKLRREFVDRYLERIVKSLNNKNSGKNILCRYSSSYLNKLVSLIDHHFDIVIGASGLDASYLLSTISHRIGGKKIGWMHTSFEGYFIVNSSPEKTEFIQKEGAYNLAKLDQLIVLSQSDEKKYSRFCQSMGIYNPVSFSCTTPADVSSQRFIFVGSLSDVKGADVLIDAFVLFASNNDQWMLDIYGDGPMWNYITNKIKEAGLEKRVTLNHSTKKVKAAYQKAGALLFPSRAEGFGIVQGEAMTCGLPVIAHRLPITEELIESHYCGLLYDENTAEALCHLMERFAACSLEEKQLLQQNALARAEDFQKEKILEIWRKEVLIN